MVRSSTGRHMTEERNANGNPQGLRWVPKIGDAGNRKVQVADRRVEQREQPRIPVVPDGDFQGRQEADVHLVNAVERLVAGGAKGDAHHARPAVVELVHVVRAEPHVPKFVGKWSMRIGQHGIGEEQRVSDARRRARPCRRRFATPATPTTSSAESGRSPRRPRPR